MKSKFLRSLSRIITIAEKEWIQTRRDLRSLILALFLPALLILLFGYALSMDVKHVATAVFDQNKTPLSRSLIEKFAHTEYLDLTVYVKNDKEIDYLINHDRVQMGLIIPADFAERYRAGKQTDLQLIINGADSTSAAVALGYVKAIVFDFNQGLQLAELNRMGVPRAVMPLDVKSRIWYNPELKSRNFIITGMIALVMAIISALITSLTISREWERGTMETLITTPLRKYELFIGKMLPFIFIALFDVVLTVTVGHFVFNVPLKGSFIELYLVALLFLIGTSGMGMLISSATRSQVLSVQFAIIVTYLPSFVMSGFIFPILNMPFIVRAVTYLIPARYLMVYMKGIALKGIGYQMLWVQILFLFVFAAAVSVICMDRITLKLPEDQ